MHAHLTACLSSHSAPPIGPVCVCGGSGAALSARYSAEPCHQPASISEACLGESARRRADIPSAVCQQRWQCKFRLAFCLLYVIGWLRCRWRDRWAATGNCSQVPQSLIAQSLGRERFGGRARPRAAERRLRSTVTDAEGCGARPANIHVVCEASVLLRGACPAWGMHRLRAEVLLDTASLAGHAGTTVPI